MGESCLHSRTRIYEPHLAGARKCLDCEMVYNPNHTPSWFIEPPSIEERYREAIAQCEKLAETLEHLKELRSFADRGGGYYGCHCKEELEELLNYDENFNKKNWIEDTLADYNKFKESLK